MRAATAGLLVVGALVTLALVASPAQASHDPPALPLLEGDPPADQALVDLEGRVTDEGCLRTYGECRVAGTKWAAIAVAHAGVDPTRWPERNRSVHGWLLDEAGSLQDERARDCDGAPHECRALEVYSLAKSILAVEAGGTDPRNVPRPGAVEPRDLVADLLANRTAGQFGSAGYVNDDVWALLALRASNYTGPEVDEAADFVERNQNQDGGLPWTTGGRSSVDMTGAGLMALAPSNRTGFVEDALGYLASTQVRDGPDEACWGQTDGDAATAASTAWALQGLAAAGEDPNGWSVNGTTPPACLLGFQGPDGGFANTHRPGQDGTNVGATLDALAALSWTPYGSPDLPADATLQERTLRVGDAANVSVDGGVLYTNRTAQEAVHVAPEEPGERRLHGLSWEPGPRRVTVRVDVRPPLPAPPEIHAPATHRSSGPVPVNLTPGGPWTTGLELVLPDGTIVSGRHHDLALPPGLHRLAARAANALGETGPTVHHDVLVPNPAPEVAVDGPSEAAPDAAVRLHAEARDPNGGNVTLRWEAPDGTLLAEGADLTLEPRPGETRTVVAVAADPDGAATREEHTVTWRPPTVAIQGPRRAEDGTVRLQANVTPSGSEVTWIVDGTPVADGIEASLELTPGDHRVQAVATLGNATAEAVHDVQVPTSDGGDDAWVTAPDEPGADGAPDPPPPDDEAEPSARDPAPAADARETPAAGAAGVLLAGLAAGRRRRP